MEIMPIHPLILGGLHFPGTVRLTWRRAAANLFRMTRTPRTRVDLASRGSRISAALWTVILMLSFTVASCADLFSSPRRGTGGSSWDVPASFPSPLIPRDNPMSEARVALGRRLFYDTRLSGNQSMSCSSCHRQSKAFADARNLPLGSTGIVHPRNSMSLGNVMYQTVLGWSDLNTRSLEAQALIPMFGETPVEMGLHGQETVLVERLRSVPLYVTLFTAAFPAESAPVTVDNVTRAIASFERTFFSADSPYDRFVAGNASALSVPAQRGSALFFSARLHCAECHTGPLFSNAARGVGSPQGDPSFFNTGLYNIDGAGAYPWPNTGLFATTQLPSDMGRFKVPSLRNIDVTYPYMHDGSVATLDDAITHYAEGGRTITVGANSGVGRANPFKSALVGGFQLSSSERTDLLAFLRSLTDSTFLTNPAFSNPWLVP